MSAVKPRPVPFLDLSAQFARLEAEWLEDLRRRNPKSLGIVICDDETEIAELPISVRGVLRELLVLLGLLFWLSARRSDLVRPSWSLLGYVSALGLAFMLVEIPTIQKLTVYLGRPVYSLAVVLFSLLLIASARSLPTLVSSTSNAATNSTSLTW